MEITIDYEEVIASRVDKNYRLLVGKKEIEVEVSKHWYEYAKIVPFLSWKHFNAQNWGNDYTITDEDKVKKQFSEKEYDNLLDYIDKLK